MRPASSDIYHAYRDLLMPHHTNDNWAVALLLSALTITRAQHACACTSCSQRRAVLLCMSACMCAAARAVAPVHEAQIRVVFGEEVTQLRGPRARNVARGMQRRHAAKPCVAQLRDYRSRDATSVAQQECLKDARRHFAHPPRRTRWGHSPLCSNSNRRSPGVVAGQLRAQPHADRSTMSNQWL